METNGALDRIAARFFIDRPKQKLGTTSLEEEKEKHIFHYCRSQILNNLKSRVHFDFELQSSVLANKQGDNGHHHHVN